MIGFPCHCSDFSHALVLPAPHGHEPFSPVRPEQVLLLQVQENTGLDGLGCLS
jgi:hypothetical protein